MTQIYEKKHLDYLSNLCKEYNEKFGTNIEDTFTYVEDEIEDEYA